METLLMALAFAIISSQIVFIKKYTSVATLSMNLILLMIIKEPMDYVI
jgi:hypothetical protein